MLGFLVWMCSGCFSRKQRSLPDLDVQLDAQGADEFRLLGLDGSASALLYCLPSDISLLC